jgi:NTP pyrophosphatase (non-canonical NTP hydrolase)
LIHLFGRREKGYQLSKYTFDRLLKIRYEYLQANSSRPYASLHEGFAVLQEEVDELWDEVRKKHDERNVQSLLNELADIILVAKRIVADLGYFDAAQAARVIDWSTGKAIS